MQLLERRFFKIVFLFIYSSVVLYMDIFIQWLVMTVLSSALGIGVWLAPVPFCPAPLARWDFVDSGTTPIYTPLGSPRIKSV